MERPGYKARSKRDKSMLAMMMKGKNAVYGLMDSPELIYMM